MVRLLDINVLIALYDPGHEHHDLSHGWFEGIRKEGWATCPLTENGFIRIMSHPNNPASLGLPREAAKRLRQFRKSGHHVFWPDELSVLDSPPFKLGSLTSGKFLLDIYLLGLAARNKGALSTFDERMMTKCVRNGKEYVEVIRT
ncbi:MAG: VapC toxin family PIN domain ribonuclease [Opitutae bacterium]|nr:VapC toxin family PIN domain ribonuclease [Opitutae bacterium]MBT4225473.1 VapC toxin family PIN domain ribonuclease [Opitutae bacterium]MBT5379636.1 VapC toxin family PIN domain ribonuclease [Opitutae bacterium]MBT5689707.1 VapC toxin family PIN domain ribonuclease [Opitutae bacterium]MBT6462017.1 VapC toxin family PIN domain ribonuclease [Opitutae bacterium]